MKEANKKVAYLGDGTKETGEKIKAKLIELGGNNIKEWYFDTGSYFYLNKSNIIQWSGSLPEGYTLGTLDEIKPCIQGDGTEEYGKKIIEYLVGLGGKWHYAWLLNTYNYFYLKKNNTIESSPAFPEGYTEISLKEPKEEPADINKHKIVCICGSGRFLKEMHEVEEKLTLQGKIVLMIGVNTKDVARTEDMTKYKPMLDELHLRKIDLADEVFVVNVGGYIGESTKREVEYSIKKGKHIEYLEPLSPCANNYTNIAELLQGCEGMELYHVNHGNVILKGIRSDSLCFDIKDGGCTYTTLNGYWAKSSKANGGECLIFPSKENRDWSTWKKPIQFEKGKLIIVSDYKPPVFNYKLAYFDSIDEDGYYKVLDKNGKSIGGFKFAWKITDCPLPEFIETKEGNNE